MLARRKGLARVARILEHFPAGLQEQPFLRVHSFRLTRRNIEEQRIELAEALDEAAPFAIALALRECLVDIRAIEALQVPALGRNLADAIAAGLQVLPVLLQRAGLRIASAQSDDGDGLARLQFRYRTRPDVERLGDGSDSRRL